MMSTRPSQSADPIVAPSDHRWGRSRRRVAVLVVVVVSLLGVSAGPAGALLTGVDVASHQHPGGAAINWTQVRAAGHSFAFVKASEGTTYRNPYYATDFAGAASAGLFRGAYHYARPRLPLSSAIDQARYFVSITGGLGAPLDLPAVLDLEETGGLGRADLAQWARLWLGEVERLTGRPPIVYAGYYFWQNQVGAPTDIGARYRLWLPSYPIDPNSTTFRPLVPSGWATWTFWQYTSSGRVPGISGNVDLNRYCCDFGNLAALAGGARGAGNPFGNLDLVNRLPGAAQIAGWTIDPDTTSAIKVHLYVDGQWAAEVDAGASRPDVGSAYPGFGSGHGIATTIPVGAGARQLCAYAINEGSGSTNPLLGCRSLVANPVGNLESVTIGPDGNVVVSGWALDADAPRSLPIHVYVDGQWGTGTTTPVDRPDVLQAYPGTGAAEGFEARLPALPSGPRTVCAYALNIGAGTSNTGLGCRQVTVPPADPIGALTDVVVSPGSVRVTGWALDFDTPEPIGVHLYVDGQWGGAFTADAPAQAISDFFGIPGGRGFEATLPVGTGRHTVCAYGINVGKGSTNPLLGCRSFELSANPFGSLDGVSRSEGTVTLTGWGIDPDTTGPIGVHVYVDDAWGGSTTASSVRPDVGLAYPAFGSGHGFSFDVGVPAGPRRVCVYLINVGPGSTNPLLGCRTV